VDGMRDQSDESIIEAELRGTTLQVYWYMLSQNQAVGVREVQRAIGMSSPSVASHHLSKLISMELIEKRADNSYEVTRVVKVGVLKNFIDFRGKFLPRYIFVAIFFTAYTLAYLALTTIAQPGVYDRYIALVIGVVGALFAWIESVRLWKIKLT